MNINREWITPLTAGAFLLSAATGILIFFHIDSGANKFVHEWLSWALVCGVVFHVAINFKVLIKYLSTRRGMLIVGIFVAILAVSFVPLGKKDEPPFILPIRALSQVPLTTLAQVAQISPQELMGRLSKAGIQPPSDQHKLSDLVGNDTRKQIHILHAVFSESR
jgi:hypothetical protein